MVDEPADPFPPDEPNEFLESEKRRDPIEFAQKYMKQAEELMARVSNPPPALAYVTNRIEIERISNGYVVRYQIPVKVKVPGLPPGQFGVKPVQTFASGFKDLAPLIGQACLACEELESLVEKASGGSVGA